MDLEIIGEQLSSEEKATTTPTESTEDVQLYPPSQVKTEAKVQKEKGIRKRPVSNDEKKSQTEKALELAGDLHLSPFHNPNNEAFVSIPVDDHKETFALEDRQFQEWFCRKFYQDERAVLSDKHFYEFRSVMIGRALYDGPEIRVYVRVAEHDGALYLDLANDAWEAVRIVNKGWEIVPTFPVRFRRVKGMKCLPLPKRNGNLGILRQYLNMGNEDDWKIVCAWLVASLRPTGPYPILAIEGGQGTAKSTTARVLRSLIDPNTAPLRSAPKDERDLMISAVRSGCTTLENISHIPHWLSDALCRLSTGSGLATRRLYTDADEIIFEAARPVILNGIHIGITQSDLLDRTLLITLPQISAASRIPEAEFWKRFENDLPEILGALLDTAACALKHLDTVKMPSLPRMADFAKWVTAAELALGWKTGEFLAVYNRNLLVTDERALDSSPLTQPLNELLSACNQWIGTATELLTLLTEYASSASHGRPKNWPATPAQLSGILRRLVPNLAAIGIQVGFMQSNGTNSLKTIEIKRQMSEKTDLS